MRRPAPKNATPAFAEEQLLSYAKAAEEVERISKAYMPQMKNEEDPGRRAALRKKARSDMAEAIAARGLNVQKYNRITVALRSDPQLADRVRRMMGGRQT